MPFSNDVPDSVITLESRGLCSRSFTKRQHEFQLLATLWIRQSLLRLLERHIPKQIGDEMPNEVVLRRI